MDESYEAISPAAVEDILIQAFNNSLAGNSEAPWSQIAIAAAITKLAVAVERLEHEE